MAEYDTIIVKKEEIPAEDKEILLTVRELTPKDRKMKYGERYVRAVISGEAKQYPDVLWLRFQSGKLDPKPRSIKIIKDEGELMFVPRPAGRIG